MKKLFILLATLAAGCGLETPAPVKQAPQASAIMPRHPITWRTNTAANPKTVEYWFEHYAIFYDTAAKTFSVWSVWPNGIGDSKHFVLSDDALKFYQDFPTIEEARLALTNIVFNQAEHHVEFSRATGVRTN